MKSKLKRILCVDDEEDVLSVLKISLERVGETQVHCCVDPLAAVPMAREVEPDLILLDYLMPGLDGATLYKHLQADPDLARIPVVFLTAIMKGPEARKLEMLGAAGVLFKPFDALELPRKLAGIWAGLEG